VTAAQQVQKRIAKPAREPAAPADAPTVSKKLTKLWFSEN
jgi:hypothetical protein